ncbi:MAG: oxaloacetate decarboxylase subunit alpha [Hyphomicrobiales bacterium]|nr:MAG: oxaloacetate decarboxylase subunit alpha [Hyphomicrobiales bacterium]
MTPLGITELVLRDAHQSLFATRMRIDDMLPICEKLDKIGYWSAEVWGGATFDSCIRFLGEDPWERLRRLKAALPNTRTQMLFRAQNILGYRHYADDVVDRFVDRAAVNGMDVFRIFDAMNDVRNMRQAIKAVVKSGKHAQGALSYTISPVHTLEKWLDLAKRIEDCGAHSLCIKDMAGLLTPYAAEELVSRLKEIVAIPIAMHAHATTGMSTAAITKACEAGVDMVDAAISSMSQTTGHSATESIVAILQGQERDTGFDIEALEEIAAYFRKVRKKYAAFEGTLKGIDSRILVAQVPGGMLSNMENQLREQGALDRMDEVLQEIPRVRKDLGYIALVTPTSQIVGTQAVMNVLMGERYKSISAETQGILRGEYGATPEPVNAELQARVLEGAEPVTCRPADLIEPEVDRLTAELKDIAAEKNIRLADEVIDDVLTYALFPEVGLKFLQNRDNTDAFEPVPSAEPAPSAAAKAPPPAVAAPAGPEAYRVTVNGTAYEVEVSPAGQITPRSGAEPAAPAAPAAASATENASEITAPLTGTIMSVSSEPGQQVHEDEVIVTLEAMKMQTEIRAPRNGTLTAISVKQGDTVQAGDLLFVIA